MSSGGWPAGDVFTPLPASQDDEWAEMYRASGYGWCRPHGEWHRPPECPIDENGQPCPTWADPLPEGF